MTDLARVAYEEFCRRVHEEPERDDKDEVDKETWQAVAASTIRALVAENERLRAAATEHDAELMSYVDDLDWLRAKLREAVEVISVIATGPHKRGVSSRAQRYQDLARAFLATMEKPREP